MASTRSSGRGTGKRTTRAAASGRGGGRGGSSAKARRARATRARGRGARGGGLNWSLASWSPRLPELEQSERDVLALGLIALGVFMGFVLYGGWNGGGVGHGLSIALGWSVGRAKTFAPVALVAGGGVLLMRPV